MSEENSNLDESGGVLPSYVNQDGTYGDMSKASEGVRDFVVKKGFKSLDEQTAAHVELEGMLGQRDKIVIVPDEGDKAGWDKVYDRFGRPASPDKYIFKPRDGDPKAESALVSLFQEYAYQKGWNQKEFEDTITFQMDAILATDKIMADAKLEATTEAQKAIRGRFDTEDEYNKFTQKGMAFAEEFKLDNDKSVLDVLEAKDLVHDPVILDMMGQLSDLTVEDPLKFSNARHTASREDRIKEIQKDPAFVNVMHVDHYKIMEEWKQLHKPQAMRQEG
jgi:hypothetical protein